MKSERFVRHRLTRLLTATVAASLTLVACGGESVRQTSSTVSLYDRVIKDGTIRCGYVVYSPGCLKDPNTGKLSGIGIEALEMVGEKLGLKVQFTEETGWGSMIEGLETNRYDMIATPVWTNANRAKLVDFSKPLFFSPIFAYVKAEGSKLHAKNLEALNSPQFTIATVDGETAEIIAREDFPQAKKESLTQLSGVAQLLLTVSTGKADCTFAEPAVAAAFLKSNPGTIKAVGDTPIRIFPNCWMFKRGQGEYKAMIDTVLEQNINSGAMDKIIHKYEPAPKTIYRVALPYQKP
jgi:polar amino acid transport system substrate-binding protein